MKSNPTRRRFLQLSLGGLIGVTLGGKQLIKPATAADLPHLAEDDAQAAALKYVHVSPESDKHCENCALIQGTDGDEWRPCALFPGKAVNAKGWCSAYAPKPS
ncbi:high-potential iron-sulfur protein [Photobacterium swingsii]|uniref:high-potential iron-sulfur protein n=1 Tax=Photobacterium swingsii TaxID=680026 RepID=UPI004067FB4E